MNEMMLLSLTGSGKYVFHGKPFPVITLVLGHFLFLSEKLKTPSFQDCCVLVMRESVLQGTFLVVQWLRLWLPIQWAGVQALVRELRSHILQQSMHAATETESSQNNKIRVKLYTYAYIQTYKNQC